MVVVPPVVVVVVAAPNDGPRKASVATGSAARRDELNAMARSFIVYVFRKWKLLWMERRVLEYYVTETPNQVAEERMMKLYCTLWYFSLTKRGTAGKGVVTNFGV